MNDRPPQIQRNSHPGPGVRNIDFRVMRDVPVHDGMHFEFIAEAFNLMNHLEREHCICDTTCTDGTYRHLPGGPSSYRIAVRMMHRAGCLQHAVGSIWSEVVH